MSDNSAPRAGVLGLGLIGSRVAARLRDAGFPLAVWNRTARDFGDALPCPRRDPADVARDADVLQIFVSDDAALRETVRALLPTLGARHVVLCHATVSPRTVRSIAEQVAATGAAFLDAPFTGSRDAAATGRLAYYVSGCRAALERARPVLDVSACAIVPFGDIGEASAIKIATNVVSAAAATSLAEAVNLLRAQGVDPRLLAAALEHNAARSGVTDLKLPCILDGDFSPRFSARNMLKDMRLARDLAEPGRSSLITCIESLLDSACGRGLADRDFSVVAAEGGLPAAPVKTRPARTFPLPLAAQSPT